MLPCSNNGVCLELKLQLYLFVSPLEHIEFQELYYFWDVFIIVRQRKRGPKYL